VAERGDSIRPPFTCFVGLSRRSEQPEHRVRVGLEVDRSDDERSMLRCVDDDHVEFRPLIVREAANLIMSSMTMWNASSTGAVLLTASIAAADGCM
jgi:hypothetical protein